MAMTLQSLQSAQSQPFQRLPFLKNAPIAAARISSPWTSSILPANGNNIAGVTVCDRNLRGALYQAGATVSGNVITSGAMLNSSGVQRVVGINLRSLATTASGRLIILCDQLGMYGGLDGTVTGAQTLNIPASSRYAVGAASKGIMVALTITTSIGATGTTCNLSSYTNQDGTSGRVGPLTDIGGSGHASAGQVFFLPLAAGDTGVRSVETFTLTATTGTAGAYMLTTVKPLLFLPTQQILPTNGDHSERSVGFVLPAVPTDACLILLTMAGASGTGITSGELLLGEE